MIDKCRAVYAHLINEEIVYKSTYRFNRWFKLFENPTYNSVIPKNLLGKIDCMLLESDQGIFIPIKPICPSECSIMKKGIEVDTVFTICDKEICEDVPINEMTCGSIHCVYNDIYSLIISMASYMNDAIVFNAIPYLFSSNINLAIEPISFSAKMIFPDGKINRIDDGTDLFSILQETILKRTDATVNNYGRVDGIIRTFKTDNNERLNTLLNTDILYPFSAYADKDYHYETKDTITGDIVNIKNNKVQIDRTEYDHILFTLLKYCNASIINPLGMKLFLKDLDTKCTELELQKLNFNEKNEE